MKIKLSEAIKLIEAQTGKKVSLQEKVVLKETTETMFILTSAGLELVKKYNKLTDALDKVPEELLKSSFFDFPESLTLEGEEGLRLAEMHNWKGTFTKKEIDEYNFSPKAIKKYFKEK